MTREEAIKELTELLPEEFLSEYTDAIKMGIEALEQEPCADTVSRKAVIDTLTKTGGIRGDALNALYDLPPVTPLPKMGRWNFTKHYGRDYYVCSVCGMERMDDHSSGWNYCPNCGAKMSEISTGSKGSEK